MELSLTEELARWIEQVDYAQLPTEVVERTKVSILDWLGNVLAGSTTPPARMIHQLIQGQGGIPQVTVLGGALGDEPGRWLRTSVLWAVLANGGSSHVVELDDVHKGAILHPGTVVIPAAVAVAEHLGLPGRRLIEAVVVGFDVCIRIGEAVTPSHYRFFHTTGTAGTFGAAAAVGKLLGLGVGPLVDALGNAGTQAAGLWEFIEDGAMSKHLHAGKAGMNGAMAALLAQKGFTGARRILEGDRGFFRAMAAEYDPSRVIRDLGSNYKILENCFKIHSSCRHTHNAIDLVIDLVTENDIEPEEIEAIEVGTYLVALDITDQPDPQTVYAAKFSLQFCVALAAVKKRASRKDFNETSLWDPVIRGVMSKIRVAVDPECEAVYPNKWAARVVLRTRSGARYTGRTDYPRGDFENPVMTEELVAKFRDLAAEHVSEARLERWVDQILRLEKMSNVRELWAN
ncbi:MmgE/PrpD family protein [Kyrpidia sp.]|uniref:MmgE/PrpD family protein n=1 Tax=Kyrpidia sp. TaxID=2073077 RepID=UPI002587FE3B|nr:MmgE/PrpD family protein [Kyrpidia sp.]MCL6575710.1 MmgE/PrpD family protein [Kyrpidia sp.]